MINRAIKQHVIKRAQGRLGRLLVITGARQTGKTTLARRTFGDLPFISLEDPTLRPAYTRMSAAEWIERYPRAVLDEVQKAPTLIESIKAAYDRSEEVRYVLLGSAQILLLSKVKESMAGRAAIEELWPLTLPEMATTSWEDPVSESRLVSWLRKGTTDLSLFRGIPVASRSFARFAGLFDFYLKYGGMPVVHHQDITNEERRLWLRDYQRTYLERDVADLAVMSDLEPFVLAQSAIASRSGKLVNFSDLARAAAVSANTARRYLRYLELSYQVVILRPYFRNMEKRLSKAPKVHFLDPGIRRAIVGRTGDVTGEEYESAVAAEILKQLKNARLPVDLHFIRTYDGREVDILIETSEAFVAIEIKSASRVAGVHARSLRGLQEILDKPLLGAFVFSQDREIHEFEDSILAVPSAWALSPIDE